MWLRANTNVMYLVVATAMCLGVSTAQGVPSLQLYMEGATYEAETQTWVLAPPGSSSGDSFRLWTLGNIDGPGGQGTLENVRLSVAYDGVGLSVEPTITLTSSLTSSLAGVFGGWTDWFVPVDPGVPIRTVTDGSSPILGDGGSLPSHGIFGQGTHWQEFGLGNFDETGDSIGDIIDEFPLNPSATGGQINVYDISVLNGSGLSLHFDLYDTLVSNNHAKFAPFSHDAEIVPIPGGAVLAMAGFGLIGFLKRRLR